MRISLALVAALAGSAAAQSANAQAEVLFNRGRELMAAKQYNEACAAFESSQKLDPAVTTQLNLADCREKNSQLVSAWAIFVDVQRRQRGATDPAGKQLLKIATDHATALVARLSKLTIDVPAPNRIPGLVVIRDGEEVGDAAWGLPLPVDGGTHAIVARAPGHVEWMGQVTIENDRDAKTIEIPTLAATPKTEAPAPVVPAAPAPVVPIKETTRHSRVPAIAAAAGAVAFGGVALGFELSARGKHEDADRLGDTAEGLALWDSANTRRHVAQAFGVAALGCAGVSVWLFLRGGGSSEPTRTAITPVAGPSLTGLAMSGAF